MTLHVLMFPFNLPEKSLELVIFRQISKKIPCAHSSVHSTPCQFVLLLRAVRMPHWYPNEPIHPHFSAICVAGCPGRAAYCCAVAARVRFQLSLETS